MDVISGGYDMDHRCGRTPQNVRMRRIASRRRLVMRVSGMWSIDDPGKWPSDEHCAFAASQTVAYCPFCGIELKRE